MELKDYTTEELRSELKRRGDLAKAEKAEVKRCRMCKHWGKISNNGNSYCYLTSFGDIFVETRRYRESPCFRVYKQIIYDTKR